VIARVPPNATAVPPGPSPLVGEGAQRAGEGAPPTGPLPRGAVEHPRRLATGLTPEQLALLLGEYDNMLSCIRCGQCLTSCPTYVLSMHEAEGPRGRVALARALAEGHLALTDDLVEHEQNCLVCDACTAVCPAGVHMDPLQVALRSAIEPQRRRPMWERALRHVVFRRIFPDMRAFRLLVRVLWLYQRTGLQWLARRSGLLRLLGLHQSEAFLPAIASSFLIPDGTVHPAHAAAPTPAPETNGHTNTPAAQTTSTPSTVSLFAGCVMSTALADIDRATVRVLQRAGCDVVMVKGQGCCGALNAHGGDLPAALEMAKQTITAFEQGEAGAQKTPIVVNSAGCGAMLKDYAHHFRDDPDWAPRAAAFSGRVKDVTEFLAGRPLPLRRRLDLRVTYQEPCHLAHAQRIRQQPRALLRSIPGVQLVEMDESTLCCGSAGIYNVTNPKESGQLQQRKLANARATEAQVVATANPGCLLQLQSGARAENTNLQIKHIVELLDEATS
jgi:glycolate oxidase iron-sulfur subunit